MIKFIEENYQWFFSGIGVTLLLALINFIRAQIGKIKKGKKKTKQQSLQKTDSTSHSEPSSQKVTPSSQSKEPPSPMTASSGLSPKTSAQGKTPPRIMEMICEDGSTKNVEIVVAFELKDTKQEYIVYTEGERDQYDNITVYVSKVDRSQETPRLIGVNDGPEWERVRKVLKILAIPDDEQPVYDKSGIELL